jgi:formyl-CoA transferase
VPEALAQPQVAALGLRQGVPGEDYTLTGLPLSFDGHRPGVARGAPRLGGSNAEFGMPLPPGKQPA